MFTCCFGEAGGSSGRTVFIDSHHTDLVPETTGAADVAVFPQSPSAAAAPAEAPSKPAAAPPAAPSTPAAAPEAASKSEAVATPSAPPAQTVPAAATVEHKDEPAKATPAAPEHAAAATSAPLSATVPAAPVQPEALVGHSYVVEVTKGPKGLGLAVDTMDPNLCIIKGVVQGSTLHDWNKTCAEGHAVRGGHRLVSVNGHTGDTNALVKKLQQETTLKLTMQKPLEHIVSLNKSDKPLGVSVNLYNDSFGMIVKEIQSGAAADPNMKLKVGDRIVGVNGQAGDAATLMPFLKSSQNLELKVLSYQ